MFHLGLMHMRLYFFQHYIYVCVYIYRPIYINCTYMHTYIHGVYIYCIYRSLQTSLYPLDILVFFSIQIIESLQHDINFTCQWAQNVIRLKMQNGKSILSIIYKGQRCKEHSIPWLWSHRGHFVGSVRFKLSLS